MAKPTAKSTVQEMKDYIRSNKLNKAPIPLGMKRAELIAGLRKLGHWDAQHDGAAPRRKPPAPRKPKKPVPKVPKAIEDRPAPAGNDARSKALKVFESVKDRAVDSSEMKKVEKILKDPSLTIIQGGEALNGALYGVKYNDSTNQGKRVLSEIMRLKSDGRETNLQKIDRILKANGRMTLTEYKEKIKKILAGKLFNESSAQQRREILQVMKDTGLPVPYETLRKRDEAEPGNLERKFGPLANRLEKKEGGAPAQAPAQAPVRAIADAPARRDLKRDTAEIKKLLKAKNISHANMIKPTANRPFLNTSMAVNGPNGVRVTLKMAEPIIKAIRDALPKDLLDQFAVSFYNTGYDNLFYEFKSGKVIEPGQAPAQAPARAPAPKKEQVDRIRRTNLLREFQQQHKKSVWQILTLKPTATREAVKSRGRELMRKHHPDKGGDKETFQRVQQAVKILMDTFGPVR